GEPDLGSADWVRRIPGPDPLPGGGARYSSDRFGPERSLPAPASAQDTLVRLGYPAEPSAVRPSRTKESGMTQRPSTPTEDRSGRAVYGVARWRTTRAPCLLVPTPAKASSLRGPQRWRREPWGRIHSLKGS